MYVLGLAVYAILGTRQHIPVLRPDEFSYKQVAQSIAHGDGFTWRGGPFPIRAALYVLYIVPAWLWAHGASAYTIAKLEGAVAICATAIPIWLFVRPVVGWRWASAAAALSLCGTWMLASAGILTENLALPLTTAALCSTVMLLRRPSVKWLAAAVCFAALAAFARLEMIALGPVIFGAVALNLLRTGGALGDRLRATRPALVLVAAGIVLLGILYLAAPHALLGRYENVRDWHIGVGTLLGHAGTHLFGLLVLTGVVPAIAVVAGSSRPANWRSDDTGPLLLVIWLAGVAFALVAAAAMIGFRTAWPIERYVEYPAPLMLAALVILLVQRRIGVREIAPATAAIAALALLVPNVRNLAEQRGLHAVWAAAHGIVGGSAGVALALATVLAGGVLLLAVKPPSQLRLTAVGAAIGVLVVTGAVLVGQSRDGWHWQLLDAKLERSSLPRDLEWLRHSGVGPVARLLAGADPLSSFDTDFYNDNVTQEYAPVNVGATGVYGKWCPWSLAEDGTARFGTACGVPPSRFLLDDWVTRITFYDQRVLASAPNVGKVVAVRGNPRVMAVLLVPCGYPRSGIFVQGLGRNFGHAYRPCQPKLAGDFYLPRAETLVLGFRGGANQELVTVGGGSATIPARGPTVLRFNLPKGHSHLDMTLSWDGYLGKPTLTSAALQSSGRATSLL